MKNETTNFRTLQTGPNRGSITILFPITNEVAYGPFPFYVNRQVDQVIASSRLNIWSSEGLEASSIQELATKLALRKGDLEGGQMI